MAGAEGLGAGGQAVDGSPRLLPPTPFPLPGEQSPSPPAAPRSRAALPSQGPMAITGLVVQNIV